MNSLKNLKPLRSAVLGTMVLLGFQQAHAIQIRLTQNVKDTFQVAQILAYERGTGTNIAAAANGGSVASSPIGHGGLASYAIDGNTDQTWPIMWHSSGGQGSWIEVTLAPGSSITGIDMYGRLDSCCTGRFNNFQLQVWDDLGALRYDQAMVGFGSAAFASVALSVPETGHTSVIFASALIGLGFLRKRGLRGRR